MTTKQILAALSVAALTTAATASAAESQDNPWRFGATLPLWAPQVDGNATVKGNKQDVDLSFDQLKDHLDASFSLGLEARKGKLGLYGGVSYMKFRVDGSTGGGNDSSVEQKIVIANAGVSYLLVKTGEEHPFVLEGTAGIRYWYLDTEMKISGAGGSSKFTDTRDLVDPLIGLRASQFLTSKLHLDFAGDIGGFGISDNQADLDWSATGVLTYDFAKWFSLSAGYQALALDTSEGSGSSKNGIDVIFHGVLIAAKFKF